MKWGKGGEARLGQMKGPGRWQVFECREQGRQEPSRKIDGMSQGSEWGPACPLWTVGGQPGRGPRGTGLEAGGALGKMNKAKLHGAWEVNIRGLEIQKECFGGFQHSSDLIWLMFIKDRSGCSVGVSLWVGKSRSIWKFLLSLQNCYGLNCVPSSSWWIW